MATAIESRVTGDIAVSSDCTGSARATTGPRRPPAPKTSAVSATA